MEDYRKDLLTLFNEDDLPKEEYAHIKECIDDIVNPLSQDSFMKIEFLLDSYKYSFEDLLEEYDDIVKLYRNMDMSGVARQYVEDYWEIDNNKMIYVDYERLGNDMRVDGNYHETDNDVFEYIG